MAVHLSEQLQHLSDALRSAETGRHDGQTVSVIPNPPPEADRDEIGRKFKEAIAEALKPEPEFSIEDKAAFLAHILTDRPMVKRFDLGPEAHVVFHTIPSSIAVPHAKRIMADPSPTFTPERKQQAIVLSHVRTLMVRDEALLTHHEWKLYTESDLDTVLIRLPIGLVHMLMAAYRSFTAFMEALAERGLDRSFWQTP